MRILYVTNYYPPHHVGGYELHCAQAAEWLAGAGHRVRILTGDHVCAGATESEQPDGLEVHRALRLRYWRDVADPAYWWREWRDLRVFRYHLRRFRPDLVVLWNMRKLASGLALCAQREAPALLYHLMDEWAAEFRNANGLPQFFARPARSPWGRLLKPALRAAHRLVLGPDASHWTPRRAVLVSHPLGELMERSGVHFDETYVSPITYDPAEFDIDWDAGGAAEDDAVRFLWAGRMCRGKGLFTTLDALDRLWDRRPGAWRVDFLGPVDSRDVERDLRERIDRSPWGDRVAWHGTVSHAEMAIWYRDHDAFLFTSEVHEGLPGTLVEALAGGLPLIATQTGGTRDLLREGENCIVYPLGDAEALADAMKRLIDDDGLRERLAEGNRREAHERFSTTAVFPRLFEYYRKVVDEEAEGMGAP